MSMGTCIKTASDLLKQIGGMDLMAGFHRELQSALESVNAIKGPVRSNYRAANQLNHMLGLTQKVLAIMEAGSL